MATAAVSAQRQAVPVRQRPNITEMTAPQVAELRTAMEKLQGKNDDRGYQRWAGVHGLPGKMFCDTAHGQPSFLPWHRAYLYRFELALRDTGHDVMLPWWDWTRTREVPTAYAEPERPDGTPNPLRSVRINDVALQEGSRSTEERTRLLAEYPDTGRNPGRPGTTLPTGRRIEEVLAYDDFGQFTEYLENDHGDVHIWVGGHMTDIPFAAYDPLFWAHHCMIDRIWRKWQLAKEEVSLPAGVLGQVMEPFNMTAADVLDPTALGYDYAISVAQVRPPQ